MPDDKPMYYCEKCHKTMRREQFYVSNNLEKYPNEGVFPQCKKCMTMHVDNWNPDTFLWILQEADVPYIPQVWDDLLVKYGKDKKKVSGMTIIGRYLSLMKLTQYKDYRWEHTSAIQETLRKEMKETMKRQGYDPVQINEAVSKVGADIPDGKVDIPQYDDAEAPAEEEPKKVEIPVEQEAKELGLTDEDVLYLRLKWGKMYRPEEWVILEQLYTDMMNSYDIQSAGDINTLKLACKSSLKANQLIDLGDIDGAQKAAKMYDSQMKAGKWTAAQNKTEESELVDSIGELVAICEKDGFIPAFYVDSPKDKADRVIQDMQMYTRELVTNELGLGNLIENAVKGIEIEKEQIKEAREFAENQIDEDDSLFNYDRPVLDDSDFQEFNELQQMLEDKDSLLYKAMQEDGDVLGSE